MNIINTANIPLKTRSVIRCWIQVPKITPRTAGIPISSPVSQSTVQKKA